MTKKSYETVGYVIKVIKQSPDSPNPREITKECKTKEEVVEFISKN